jgi:RNA polymerase sigma-70 factor (ECF subfamily)
VSVKGTSGDDVGPYNFDTLCTPHYQALVHYASRLLPGRPAEVRDLVQESFLKAVRWWPKWHPSTGEDPAQAARGWLHRIVQNAFLDRARYDQRCARRLDDNHETVVENTYGVEADHNIQVLSDGVGDEVRRALAELDKDHREVVVRADFSGEAYLVIAAALEIPIGTVMSRLHRGRKKLADALKEYAKAEYGISRKSGRLAKGTKVDTKAAPEDSDGAGLGALTDEPAEPPEADADCIDRIVTWDDSSELFEA